MDELLSEEQIDEFKEAFELFDKGGDGTITTQELALAMRCLGQNTTDSGLKEIIKEIDPVENDKIDFQEFLALMIRKNIHGIDAEEDLKVGFQVFDKD